MYDEVVLVASVLLIHLLSRFLSQYLIVNVLCGVFSGFLSRII